MFVHVSQDDIHGYARYRDEKLERSYRSGIDYVPTFKYELDAVREELYVQKQQKTALYDYEK